MTTYVSSTSRLAQRLRKRREAKSALPRRRNRILAAAAAAVLLGVLAWPAVRAHLQAIAVLDLVANKPVPAPLRWLVSGRVTTTDMVLPLPSGPVRARLYTPVGKPNAPAFLVFHGVHYLGMDEPRLIAFAASMASCGLRVLTPELPAIKDYHIGPGSIDTIGDSAAWLAHQNGDRPVGVMGLSFSGSLALLAAGAPHFRPNIKFVVAIGSEDEMARVAEYYRTGEDQRPNGTNELLPPHEYGALVLEYENIDEFVPRHDVPALRAVLRAHLYEDPVAEAAALARLNPVQAAMSRQLMDTTSPVTRRKLAEVETRHIEDMAGVSPHGHLAQMTTPVYLLHGAGDNIIPAAETQWIGSELPSETLKASLISPVLSHLDMAGATPSLMDNLRLVHFFGLILRAAESR
jgi:dienelactone hydrolase